MPEKLNSTTKLDAGEIVTAIAMSPEFKRNQESGYNLQRSIARSALEMTGMITTDEAERYEDDLEDDFEPSTREATRDSALATLVGTLPSYVHGLEGVRHHNTINKMSYQEYRASKGRAARFNHAIKSLIEQDPSLSFDDISSTVTTLYGVMNRERWGADREGYEKEAKWFKAQFEGSLRGMQQEVVARQIIEAINQTNPAVDKKTGEYIPRVVVDPHVSIEDDLKGADLYITLDGVTFPIDIKASERTAKSIRKKSRHPKAIITSGINSYQLNGAFAVEDFRARRYAPDMLEKLYAAREEFLQQNPKIARSLPPKQRNLKVAA